MRRFAWLTDIHLNFLPIEACARFLADLAAQPIDGLLITGDIAEATDLNDYLIRLEQLCPTYFVLGNHDYYRGSVAAVRQSVAHLCAAHPRLHYLSQAEQPLELAPGIGIVGHDGWADGRLGDYANSPVSMTDFHLIDELRNLSKAERWKVLMRLGDEAADHVRRVLPHALDRYEHVLLLTHVPPLREACWHEGRISDDAWAPHFTCRAMGDAILSVMRDYPDRRLTVLCGHTHGAGQTDPLPNLSVLTGGAEYGHPAIQRIFEFA